VVFPYGIECVPTGIQTTRIVVDTIDTCNLRCDYCHPNFGWTGERLPINLISDVFRTAEEVCILEVTLTGGEVMLHPDFFAILAATDIFERTSVTLITNATLLTPRIVRAIAASRLARICASLDGSEAAIHESRRGRSFRNAMNGLRRLSDTGKPVTVISVAHQDNFSHLIELSEFLAREHLADQHHLCAPSFSGIAKDKYDELGLRLTQFYAIQESIDDRFPDLRRQGLYVTFNSFWPATGERGLAQKYNPRTMTLIQFSEQTKNIYTIVRPNGDVRLTCASWGRETVGNAVVGNLYDHHARTLFDRVDEIYRSGNARQLPRELEAAHKFQIETQGHRRSETAVLLGGDQEAASIAEWVPVRELSQIDLLNSELNTERISALALGVAANPLRFRMVRHSTGIDLLYDRRTSHMTLLFPEETDRLCAQCLRVLTHEWNG